MGHLGDRHGSGYFGISSNRRSAQNSGDHTRNSVAQQGTVKAGIFHEVFVGYRIDYIDIPEWLREA